MTIAFPFVVVFLFLFEKQNKEVFFYTFPIFLASTPLVRIDFHLKYIEEIGLYDSQNIWLLCEIIRIEIASWSLVLFQSVCSFSILSVFLALEISKNMNDIIFVRVFFMYTIWQSSERRCNICLILYIVFA